MMFYNHINNFMTSFQKYISFILTVLVIMVWYYLFNESIKPNSEEWENQLVNKDLIFPNEYHIRIAHAWWTWIRNRTTEIIWIWDWDERYLNEPDYKKDERSPSFMNKWWDIIWLTCNEWYTRQSCRSDSNTDLRIDEDWSCWIPIDKEKIFWRLECIKN